MANIPTNFTSIRATTGVTGSLYAGFIVATNSASFSSIKDGQGNDLGALVFPAGTMVPLTVSSASFTGGPVLFFT